MSLLYELNMRDILNYIQNFTNRFIIYTDDICHSDDLIDLVGKKYMRWLFDLREINKEKFIQNYLSLLFTECIYIDILLYHGEYYMCAHDTDKFVKVSLTDIKCKIDGVYEFIWSNWDYHGLDDDFRNIPSRRRNKCEDKYVDMEYERSKRRKIE